MTEQEKLIAVARSQIGTAENPLGSNTIKYTTEYYGHPVTGNSYAWCMIFVWWCFKEAGLSEYLYNGKKIARCTVLMVWAANHGLFVTKDFQAGDVFLYDNDGNMADSEHTGIYTGEMVGGKYVAIEGNYADKVSVVHREPSSIIGAYRPPWTGESVEPPKPVPSVEVHLPELQKGDTGESVKAMQLLLIGRGFSCGPDGADGDFGKNTDTALRKYQIQYALGADGICGVRTWSALLGV